MGLELEFFASPLAAEAAVRATTEKVRRELAALEPTGTGPYDRFPGDVSVPAAVVLTGGTEDKVLQWLDGKSGPALLLALPHSNSLPACLETLARLRQLGRSGSIIVVGRGRWREDLAAVVRRLRLAAFLREARIGLLGGPSSWLAASSPDPEILRRMWGPEVVTVPLSEVVQRWRVRAASAGGGGAAGTERSAEVERALQSAAQVVEPDAGAVGAAVDLYLTLRDLVRDYRLSALTIRCFDLLDEIGTTGCYALSRLNDEGLVAGCEGDLPATLTMLVLGGLAGRACFMANPSDLDLARGTVTFGHCSVPLSLVRTHRLRSHFESGLGVGLEGHFGPGKMTVARIGGAGLDEVRVFSGTVVGEDEAPFRDDLCRTQVTLRVSPAAAGELLARPLGNHHVLCPGEFHDDLLEFVFGRVADSWRLTPAGGVS